MPRWLVIAVLITILVLAAAIQLLYVAAHYVLLRQLL
jgi:hypothetical protein